MAHDTPPSDSSSRSDPLAAFRVKRCLKCDYDLAGLPPDHACPECGTGYSRDLLVLVGWSHVELIPGTGMWWVHRIVFGFLWLLGLIIVGGIATAASGAGSSAALFVPLGYIALGAWLYRERRKQVSVGGDMRLLVTAQEIKFLNGPQHLLLRRLETRGMRLQLGYNVRRLSLKKRRGQIWELRLDAGPLRSFVLGLSMRIVLRCGEDEIQALCHELRLRIAHAIERDGG